MRTRFVPFLVLFAASPVFAGLTLSPEITVNSTTYDVQSITVSGAITNPATANYALMVVDFDPSHVYLFGYEWQSGTKTGYDMFTDVAANPANPSTLSYDLPFGPGFVASIGYGGIQTNDQYDNGSPYSAWDYLFSDNGSPFFFPPDFGATGRTLSNGSIDDWSRQAIAPSPPDYGPTRDATPLPGVALAPEPASLMLLGFAAPALLLVRRKRR